MVSLKVLSAPELKRLGEHKYSVESASFIEPKLEYYWEWLVDQVPAWWSPNAISLAGLLANVVCTLLLMCYSPDAKQEPPGWTFFFAAVGLFVFQSLDGIDGKQARKLNIASPLGELFDHGCDAVTTVFLCIELCITLQLGNEKPQLLFLAVFSGLFVFYAGHWQAYCSGTLKFGVYDACEGQYTLMLLLIVTGLVGPSFWSNPVPMTELPIKHAAVFGSSLGLLFCFKTYLGPIFLRGGVGKNGSTVAGTSILSPASPFGIVVLLALMIWQKSPSHIFEQYPILFTLGFGMSSAKICIKLMVAKLCKSEIATLDSSMIGPGMLFFNQYFDCVINEHIVLWLCFLFCSGDFLWYSVRICRQISDYLNIYCLKVPASSPTGPGTNGGPVDSAIHSRPSAPAKHRS